MRRLVIPAAALALLSPLALGPTAHAGPAGSWTTVTGPAADIGNIARPSAYRTVDGVLHLVYTVQESRSTSAIEHVAIGDDGQVLATTSVVSGWSGLTGDPAILPTADGALRVVFSGIRTTDAGETYDGAMTSAISRDGGATWSLESVFRTQSGSAYASYGTGATLAADGSTYVAFPLNSTIRYSNIEVPARTTGVEDPQFSLGRSDGTSDCCAYDVHLATEPSTGAIWMSWYANGSDYANRGYFVRQVAPSLGAVQRIPRSFTSSDSNADGTISPGEGEAGELGGGGAMVSTADGVFVAYQVGYPQAGVGVWRIGSTSPVIVPVKDALYASIAADSEGRIWAVWYDDDNRHVYAARSNPAVTRFGQPVDLGAPRVGGEASVWSVLINARTAGNQADVVVNTKTQLMHQEVFAGLTLNATPGSWKAAKKQTVTFTVTDAGLAVPGAKVSVPGDSCTTGGTGRCTIVFGATKKPAAYLARATKATYTADTVRVRSRR